MQEGITAAHRAWVCRRLASGWVKQNFNSPCCQPYCSTMRGAFMLGPVESIQCLLLKHCIPYSSFKGSKIIIFDIYQMELCETFDSSLALFLPEVFCSLRNIHLNWTLYFQLNISMQANLEGNSTNDLEAIQSPFWKSLSGFLVFKLVCKTRCIAKIEADKSNRETNALANVM